MTARKPADGPVDFVSMPATTGATSHSSRSLIASIAPFVPSTLWRYRKDFDGGDRG